MNRRKFILKVSTMGIGFVFATYKSSPSFAQEQLSPSARRKQARAKWNSLTAEQKKSVLKKWKTFQKLPENKKQRLKLAYRKFKEMPRERRQKIRSRIQRWRAMSPAQQRRLKHNFKKWRALPQGKRKALKKRIKNMSPDQRRKVRRRLRRSK